MRQADKLFFLNVVWQGLLGTPFTSFISLFWRSVLEALFNTEKWERRITDICDAAKLNTNTQMLLVQTQICTTQVESLCEFTFRK